MTSPPPPPPPPPLSLHLSDTSLKPLLSTAPPPSPQSKSLRALTTAALGAHTSASRLGLGYPVHILVETRDGGPVAMHAFLDPEARRGEEGVVVRGKGVEGPPVMLSPPPTGLVDVNGGGEEEGQMRSVRGSARGSPDVGGAEEGGGEGEGGEHHSEAQGQGQRHEELTNGAAALQIADPSAAATASTAAAFGEEEEGGEASPPLAPMLVATVVAESYSRSSEARRAVRRLEGMGREFQEQWVRDREQELDEEGDESEVPSGERDVDGSGADEVRVDCG